MAANIQEFKSSFTTDLARASRFDVYISLPSIFMESKASTHSMESLSFRCESAELPGRSIATTDLQIYGPSEKMPYQTMYNDITLTFICSDSMEEKILFDMWMEYINPSTTHNFTYKDSYTANKITINQYDVVDTNVYTVDLIDAFPIAVNQLDLNWSSDSTHKISVVFAYTKWEYRYTDPQSITAPTPSSLPIGAILQIGSLALSARKSLSSGNPFALLSLAGAASSTLPGLGINGTLSSVLNGNSAGSSGTLDTLNDSLASAVNSAKNSLSRSSLF